MVMHNKTVGEFYDFLFTELGDHRTNNWPLIASPIPGLTILGFYLYFVLNWGPKFMQDRKPFKLKNLIILHNFIQVLMSLWLFLEGFDIWMGYDWKCQNVDYSYSRNAIRMAIACYIYFIAKMLELLDTVFFVLRKKNRQVSFLQVYHHTIMPMLAWGGTKYFPGGHGTFIGVVNSFIHIIMYSYYTIAAMGPQFYKYLWWKKYITILQMIQFIITFLHSSLLLFYDCGYPRWYVFLELPNLIFFLFLFGDFYTKNYKSLKKENQKLESKDKCKKVN